MMSQITGLSHDTLMLLNIILASVNTLLLSVVLYLFQTNQLPPSALLGFLIVSIVVCLLIILFSVDCKNMTM